MNHILSVLHIPSRTVAFRLFDLSRGHGGNLYTWQWSIHEFATSLAAAEQDAYIAATEKTDAGDSDISTYSSPAYNMALVNNTSIPMHVVVQAVDTTDTNLVIQTWDGFIVAGKLVSLIVDDVNVGSLISSALAALTSIDGKIDGIAAKTVNLPASPAAVGSEMALTSAYDAAKTAASSTALAATDAKVDSVLTDTGTTIPGLIEEIGSSVGSGARTITITVDDGTDPLEGAKVRLTKGAESYVATTNASGVATLYVDDGTWNVIVTLPLYTFAATTITVDGDETVSYSMSALSLPSSSAGLVTGYYYCYDEEGEPEEGVEVHIKAYSLEGTGISLDGTIRTVTSDSNGLAAITNMVKGGKYWVRRGASEELYDVSVASDAVSPVALTNVIGADID